MQMVVPTVQGVWSPTVLTQEQEARHPQVVVEELVTQVQVVEVVAEKLVVQVEQEILEIQELAQEVDKQREVRE